MPKPVKIFISYSHEDERFRRELVKHLKPLEREGVIELWSDRMIDSGDEWRRAIDKRIDQADLFVPLLSANFLSSEYCTEVEMRRAFSRHKKGVAKIVPVVVSHYSRVHCPFREIQASPHDALPVESYHDRNKAWEEVTETIIRAAESLHMKRQNRHEEGGLLEQAYRRLEEANVRGGKTAEIMNEILQLKRQLRRGPCLSTGDILGDGQYRLLEIIGVGAFATVWQAYDRSIHRMVALKVLHGQWSRDRTRVERFRKGAAILASLRHPCIVSVIDQAASEDDYHCFVMEYLDGGDLMSISKAELSLAQRFLIIVQVADALQFAHDRGIIHRDLKPQNIILDAQGNAKLTDFDLVRVLDDTFGTCTGALGSFLFSAPEALANAAEADVRSDVYSLAMTTLYLLAEGELSLDVVRDPLPIVNNLQCPDSIKELILGGLQWNLSHRITSAREFRRMIMMENMSPDGNRIFQGTVLYSTHTPKVEATLQFTARLSPAERFIIDGMIDSLLGSNGNCEVVYFHQQASSAVVRICADSLPDIELIIDTILAPPPDVKDSQSQMLTALRDLDKAKSARAVEKALYSLRKNLAEVKCFLPDGNVAKLTCDRGASKDNLLK